jgi:hypothetical protein
MKVLVLTTWENVKSEEGLKRYYGWQEKNRDNWMKKREKLNVKHQGWSDGTGKMYMMDEFDSWDSYAKFQNDEELQKSFVTFCRTVKNAKVKVLRGSLQVPP